jgi:hypothetical protein
MADARNFPEETREDFLFATTGRHTTWVRREQQIGFILWQQYQQPRVSQTSGKCTGKCFHMCYNNPSVKFARRIYPRFVFRAFTTLRRHSIRNIPPILPGHMCLKIPYLILSFQGTSIPATQSPCELVCLFPFTNRIFRHLPGNRNSLDTCQHLERKHTQHQLHDKGCLHTCT